MRTTPCICGERVAYGRAKYCNECSYELSKVTGRDRTRQLVRMRDKHTCQDCGRKKFPDEKRLDVHHINGLCGKLSLAYDKTKDLSGMITLCHKCHYNRPEHTFNKYKKIDMEGKKIITVFSPTGSVSFNAQ